MIGNWGDCGSSCQAEQTSSTLAPSTCSTKGADYKGLPFEDDKKISIFYFDEVSGHFLIQVELILGKNVYFPSSTMGLFTMLALMLEGSPSLGVQPG